VFCYGDKKVRTLQLKNRFIVAMTLFPVKNSKWETKNTKANKTEN
jgi:hypothetical protein